MNLDSIINFLIPMVAGIIVTIAIIYFMAPKWMIIEDRSKYSQSETIEMIVENAEKTGWKVPGKIDLQESMRKAGYNVLPTVVIELCQPDHAVKILDNDKARIASSMMPCRIAVYEKKNGDVIISRVNNGFISNIFGGKIMKTMTIASKDIEQVLEGMTE